MSDDVTLSRWFARLSVDSALPELKESLTALLGPYFPPGPADAPGALKVSIRRTASLPVAYQDLEAVPRTPQLWLDEDGPRLVVLEQTPARMVLIRDMERDSEPVLITVDRTTGTILLEVLSATPGTQRAVVRLVTFFLSAQLHSGGVPVLHGSAVARDGKGVVILGPSSSGKSTLSFLASTLAGWDFVSDDTLLVWRDRPGGPMSMSGAPRRMGIGVGSLIGHPAKDGFETFPLRRYNGSPVGPLPTPSADSWSREGRVRVYCDIDEFTAITGTRVDQHSTPTAVVLPTADRHMSGWRIEDAGEGDAPELEPTSGRNLRYFVDYLGVLAPRPLDEAGREQVLADLRRLPRVRVRYGPDVNADFPRFWSEVTAAVGVTEAQPC